MHYRYYSEPPGKTEQNSTYYLQFTNQFTILLYSIPIKENTIVTIVTIVHNSYYSLFFYSDYRENRIVTIITIVHNSYYSLYGTE